MKLTEADMNQPRFWFIQRQAERAVHGSLANDFLAAMTDKEAKAVADAVDALTKVGLMQSARDAKAFRARHGVA